MSDAPVIVRVKPLVWEEWVDAPVKVFCAQTVIGRYKVQERANGAGWMLVFPNGNITNRDTEEAAKAAAQADYEARILAALDLTPDPRVTALVEAAEALGVRKMVAGWNGEGRETPYTPHPPHLWAKITTTCGAVYALDAALAAFKGGNNE